VKVAPYHTKNDETPAKYHTWNDCPAGERIIKDGNKVSGMNGTLCDFCKTKDLTGHF